MTFRVPVAASAAGLASGAGAAVGAVAFGELEIKKSRFLAFIGRTDTEDAAREFIHRVRGAYPDARHHCSAFIEHVDGAQPILRSSDDGEPSGTAGKPMLDVLTGSGLENITAVVVRYFGGIKLGTGGLVRAYSDATAAALASVAVAVRAQQLLFTVVASHTVAGRLATDLRGAGFEIVDTHYAEAVTFTVAVDPADTDRLTGFLAAATAGEVTAQAAGTAWVEHRQ